MDLTELEQHIFAGYLMNGALGFEVPNRYYPYRELIILFEDKMAFASRKFGVKMGKAAANAAQAFVEVLLERQAFSTVKQDLGGTMHQFRPTAYRDLIKELQDTNPIVRAAREAGPSYCEEAFAALIAKG